MSIVSRYMRKIGICLLLLSFVFVTIVLSVDAPPALSAVVFTLIFFLSGITHFTNLGDYVALMPAAIPFRAFWVMISAVVELLGATLIITNRYARAQQDEMNDKIDLGVNAGQVLVKVHAAGVNPVTPPVEVAMNLNVTEPLVNVLGL